MMTTNKLTKTFASGSLAIGVLAGAVLTATSASAMTLTWAVWTGGTPLQDGDKIATFVSENGFGAEAGDQVSLIALGAEYYFKYDPTTGANTSNANSGSFTYTIEVTNPNQSLVGVDLDSNVSANYGNVTETFAEIPNVLVSISGSPVPASGFEPITPKNLLTVTNTTYNPNNTDNGLFQLQNSFHQSVPEPGTVLGLLAVGGLGLVSRFKKQK